MVGHFFHLELEKTAWKKKKNPCWEDYNPKWLASLIPYPGLSFPSNAFFAGGHKI